MENVSRWQAVSNHSFSEPFRWLILILQIIKCVNTRSKKVDAFMSKAERPMQQQP
jgi:hypothetical protein